MRREWEADFAERSRVDSEAIIRSINAKFQKIRERRILAGEMEPFPDEAARLFGPGGVRPQQVEPEWDGPEWDGDAEAE